MRVLDHYAVAITLILAEHGGDRDVRIAGHIRVRHIHDDVHVNATLGVGATFRIIKRRPSAADAALVVRRLEREDDDSLVPLDTAGLNPRFQGRPDAFGVRAPVTMGASPVPITVICASNAQAAPKANTAMLTSSMVARSRRR